MTLLGALLLSSATQVPPSPAPPTFPARVDAVYLDVSVRRDSRPVPGLTAADFELTEEGSRRTVEVVEGVNAPVHAVLALDVSSSVQGSRLDALRAAARVFLGGLGAQDHVTLLTFSHHVQIETKVGASPAEASTALERAQAGGGTALFDGALAAVALADRRHGRPIVLLFSDGGDELSWLSQERLLAAARDGMGVVHVVAVPAPPDYQSAGLDDYGHAAREGSARPVLQAKGASDAQAPFEAYMSANRQAAKGTEIAPVLAALANETGGDVWSAEDDTALGRAFAAALAEVRSRYVLRFEPAGGRPGEWRDVRVRVRSGGTVRGRKGYRVP